MKARIPSGYVQESNIIPTDLSIKGSMNSDLCKQNDVLSVRVRQKSLITTYDIKARSEINLINLYSHIAYNI